MEPFAIIIKNFLGIIVDDYDRNNKLVVAVLICQSNTSFAELDKEIFSYRLGRILEEIKFLI